MSLEKIKEYLLENIGLDPESIGDASIERAIIHRLDSLGVEKYESYYKIITDNHSEFDELVEEVVVPETWFFRNLVPFEALMKFVHKAKADDYAGQEILRILSIPCSTGEEPYSIAISLLKNGLHENSFHIDAVDISKKALTKAKRAIYGKHSFREENGVDADYFQQTKAGFQVLPNVRKHVSFIKGNILNDSINSKSEHYDIIFCRNLLIYFNRDTQRNVINRLNKLLKQEGVLFVGHAETACVNKEHFSSLNIPRSFAFCKKSNVNHVDSNYENNSSSENIRLIYDKLMDVTKKDMELSSAKKNKFSSILKTSVVRKSADDSTGWWKIEKLIETGKLVDASLLCETKIKESPEEAQGYYYLGLVCSIEGNIGSADSLLRKAIYLDPNHHKAIGLLALLAEQRGENNIAESLRMREIRAKNRSN